MERRITRREALRISGMSGLMALLAACQPKVVEKLVEKEVTKQVVQTVQVVETVEVDPRRKDMTLGITRADQKGVFEHFDWGEDPVQIADTKEWFQEFYPNVEFKHSFADWDNYWTKLPVLMAADEQPDLANMWFGYTGAFATKGWMLPIDEYINTLPPPDWPNDYYKAAEDNLAYKGVQYGLAIDWAPRCIMINRDLVEPLLGKWPVDDATWTWEKILELAIALTEETPEGKQFGFFTPTNDCRMWNQAKEWGGDFFNDEITEARFGDPKTIEAFQWIWDAKYKYKLAPTGGETSQFGGDWGMFASGKIALYACLGDGARPMLESIQDKFKLGIAPEPLGPNGTRFAFEGNVGHFVPKKSRHPDIAYEWMRWYTCSDERARFLAASGFGGFPARISAGKWLVESLKEQLPEFDHAVREIGKLTEEHFPLFPQYLEWTGLYAKYVDPLLEEGQPGVKQAMQGLHEETNALLKKGT